MQLPTKFPNNFGGERGELLRRIGPSRHAIKAVEKRLKFEVKQLKEHHH